MTRPAPPRAAIGALSLAVLAGCAVGPNYKRPLVPVPAQFYGDGSVRPRPARSPTSPGGTSSTTRS